MTQWKLLPVEPTEEMLAKTSWPDCARTDYAHMLAAAPQPDVQPAIYPEEARQMGLEEVAYYTHPPAADVQELVDALRRLEEVASDCDIGYMDNAVRHARTVLEKWEVK